jgi:apolipoprotein N-acyltransferase
MSSDAAPSATEFAVAGRPLRGTALRFAGAAASGVLLALPSAYAPLFALGWFAWVPLLLALRQTSLKQSYALGVTAGLCFYIVATAWITEFLVMLKGYGALTSAMLGVLYWLYSAQVVGVIALLYAWLQRSKRIPALAVLPLIIVVAYDAFPTLFTLRLGESQSYFLPALQAVEFTGVHGLDCVIVSINIVLFAMLEPPTPQQRWVVRGAAVLIGTWFAYGYYANLHWDERMARWSRVRIGIVQPNQPASLEIPPPQPGYSRAYPPEMAQTRELAAAGADLVIWPETRFKGYFDFEHVRRAFHREIGTLTTPLLFHDTQRRDVDGVQREYNTALLIDEQGHFAGSYHKRRLIAFGEYLPLLDYAPTLQAWAQQYFGFQPVSAGTAPAVFRTARLAIVPLICYEAVFPHFVADSLARQPTGKVLATLSNDTWFGDTRQPYIHTSISILRAVENRVPLVHVVNNGPSLVVAPNGRVLFRSAFRTAGSYLVELPYAADSGGSFFSRHPRWFINAAYLVLLGVMVGNAFVVAGQRRPRLQSVRHS